MATSMQAKKRIRQNEKCRLANRQVKTGLKTTLKNLDQSIEAKDKDLAAANLKTACQELDRAARKNIIKKENASRKKGRLAKQVNNI